MAGSSPRFAPLDGRLITRGSADPAPLEADDDEPARWRDDLRLFLLAYAAGFVFFLAFIG